jgi:hypothetical protein
MSEGMHVAGRYTQCAEPLEYFLFATCHAFYARLSYPSTSAMQLDCRPASFAFLAPDEFCMDQIGKVTSIRWSLPGHLRKAVYSRPFSCRRDWNSSSGRFLCERSLATK